MMYARVLLVGPTPRGDADVLERLACGLRSGGHVVGMARCSAACSNDVLGEDDTARLCGLVRGFRPTAVLWDEAAGAPSDEAAGALRAAGCLVALVERGSNAAAGRTARNAGFDCVVSLQARIGASAAVGEGAPEEAVPCIAAPFVPDERYRFSTCSALSGREPLCVVGQRETPARRAAVDALAAAGVGALAFEPSWGALWRNPACSGGAYSARTARYAVLFDGDDASVADALLRMAEGCIALADAAALERDALSTLADAVVPFSCPNAAVSEENLEDAGSVETGALCGLAETVRRLESDDAERAAALARQQAFLDNLGAPDRAIEALVDQLALMAARLGRADVAPLPRPGKTVVLYGWFGKRNFGDDLLLRIVSERVRQRFDSSRIVVVGADAGEVERSFGFEAATPDERYRVRSFLADASALSASGGLLFDDPLALTAGEMEAFLDPWIEPTGQAAICLMARMRGVPCVYCGVGAGPVDNEDTRAAVRLIGLAGTQFVARDAETAQALLAAGVESSLVQVKADLVFTVADLPAFRGASDACSWLNVQGAFAMVSLRAWNLNPPDFVERMARALDEVIERTGVSMVFASFDPDDAALHARVLAAMKHADRAEALPERLEEERLFSLVKRSKFALAMRLHCSVLHHVLGKPAIGLNYNDKIGSHFTLMDQRDLLFPLDASPQAIGEAAEGLCDDYAARCARIADVAAEKRLVAEEALDVLFDAIDRGQRAEGQPGRSCFYPRSRSAAAEALANASARIAELEKRAASAMRDAQHERERAEALAERVSEMEESTAWKTGRALTAAPRKLKDAFGRERR